MTAIHAYGRLGGDPREHQTKAGAAMATASLAAEVGCGGKDGPPEPLWLGLVAFGSSAEALLACSKGETVSVAGRLQLNRWTGRDGEERERLQVVVETLTSARSVRPGNGKKPRRADKPPPGAPVPAPSTLATDDDLHLNDSDVPF